MSEEFGHGTNNASEHAIGHLALFRMKNVFMSVGDVQCDEKCGALDLQALRLAQQGISYHPQTSIVTRWLDRHGFSLSDASIERMHEDEEKHNANRVFLSRRWKIKHKAKAHRARALRRRKGQLSVQKQGEGHEFGHKGELFEKEHVDTMRALQESDMHVEGAISGGNAQRDAHAEEAPTKPRQKRRKVTCGWCKSPGHTKTTCSLRDTCKAVDALAKRVNDGGAQEQLMAAAPMCDTKDTSPHRRCTSEVHTWAPSICRCRNLGSGSECVPEGHVPRERGSPVVEK